VVESIIATVEKELEVRTIGINALHYTGNPKKKKKKNKAKAMLLKPQSEQE
jgi:hypothetical protein